MSSYYNLGCEVRIVHKDQEKHDNEKMKEHMMMTKHSISGLNDVQRHFTVADPGGLLGAIAPLSISLQYKII